MSGCIWPDGIINMPVSAPCGLANNTQPVVPCCVIGDECLPDNICSYSHDNQGGSGYYSAGCTVSNVEEFDNLQSNDVCVSRCTREELPDIVWVDSEGLWKCCGGSLNGRNCQNPSNDSFLAPDPNYLVAYWTAGVTPSPTPSSTSTVPTSTQTTTSTLPVSPTQEPASDGSSSLSTGAKAGIGVGAAAAGILVIGAALVLVRRRRHKAAAAIQPPVGPMSTSQLPTEYAIMQELDSNKRARKTPPRQELE